MRDYVLIYINGEKVEVRGDDAFLPLANFLRYRRRLTGTKIVCAEGDCGACTVMRASPLNQQATHRTRWRVMNSCIAPVYAMDCSHIVTIEGVGEKQQPSLVQESMVKHHGGQCGFCTPGMVMAITGMIEQKLSFKEKDVQNHLTGNLCRCTGYSPIIEAAMGVDRDQYRPLSERYLDDASWSELSRHAEQGLEIHAGDRYLICPSTLSSMNEHMKKRPLLRIMAAATDVGVQINKGRVDPAQIASLHLLKDLYHISYDAQLLSVGARVTLDQLERFTESLLPDFAQFMSIFASPQIKNVATLVGNVANGSPIADTLPFLFAAEARIRVASVNGQRQIPIQSFYKGYKLLDLRDGEWIVGVDIPIDQDRKWKLYKVSQRRDLDISCVNAAYSWREQDQKVQDVRIAYGGVGPTTLRCPKSEAVIEGQEISRLSVQDAQAALQHDVSPIDDVRGSAAYRRRVVGNLLQRFVNDVQQGNGGAHV